MKKLIYITLFALSITLTTASCTEEDVAPVAEKENGATVNNSDGKN